jgi:trehalose synthase
VIPGAPEFFEITKCLHNHLHGFAGDGGPLGESEHEVYEWTLAPSAEEFVGLVHPRDIVVLHDPQTAGLASGRPARP